MFLIASPALGLTADKESPVDFDFVGSVRRFLSSYLLIPEELIDLSFDKVFRFSVGKSPVALQVFLLQFLRPLPTPFDIVFFDITDDCFETCVLSIGIVGSIFSYCCIQLN
jgi:hypothetical protein